MLLNCLSLLSGRRFPNFCKLAFATVVPVSVRPVSVRPVSVLPASAVPAAMLSAAVLSAAVLSAAVLGCGARSDLHCASCAVAGDSDLAGDSDVAGDNDLAGDNALDSQAASASAQPDSISGGGATSGSTTNRDSREQVNNGRTTEPGPNSTGSEDLERRNGPDDSNADQLLPDDPPTRSNPDRGQARDLCPGQVVDSAQDLLDLAGCRVIVGDLSIVRTDPPLDLKPLGFLGEVSGELSIFGVPSLAGLDRLTHVGGLSIEDTALTDLSELRSLESIGSPGQGGVFRVAHNPVLQQLSGLNRLSVASQFVVQDNPRLQLISHSDFGQGLRTVSIFDNDQLERVEPFGASNLGSVELSGDSLKDLDMLTGLLVVNRLVIFETPSLEDLSGLSSLVGVSDLLRLDASGATDLDALSALRTVSRLIITTEQSLTNVDGLAQLSNIGSLTLERLPAITQMPVFEAIEEIGDISISGNTRMITGPSFPALQTLESIRYLNNPVWANLAGLDSLLFAENIELTHNDRLTTLALPSLLEVTDRLIVRCNALLPAVEIAEFETVDVSRLVETGNLESAAACSAP